MMLNAEEKNPFNVHTANKRAFSLRDHFVRPKKASNNNMTLLMPPSLDSKRFHALREAVRVNYLQPNLDIGDRGEDNPNYEVERW